MKATEPPAADHFVEEGTAFAELEPDARWALFERRQQSLARGAPNQEQAMTAESIAEVHVAPKEAWDDIAASYDRFVAPGEARLATQALTLARLRPGDRFLDVAAGTGGLSLPAAWLGAKVVATDFAPKMVECFEKRAREQGLSDAVGRVMDCHALDFPDATFDVTGSQFGVMLVPDQIRALREMVRVTKPAGRVLIVAYGSPAEFEALQCFISALKRVLPSFEGLPEDAPPLEFQVADPEVLRQRLTDAGLWEVTVDTAHHETIQPATGQELWDWCLGGNPIPSMLVAELSSEQKAQVVSALDDMVRARSSAGNATFSAPLNIGVGTKR
jgi:ubiquinone/menaquinone biosynthesis C-methylase UbiE